MISIHLKHIIIIKVISIDFSSIYKARYNNGIFEQIKHGENMKTTFPGI